MSIERIKQNFLDFTSDAVAVGYVAPGHQNARLVFVNGAFTGLFGYRPEDVLHRPVNVIHDPASWQEFVSTVGPEFSAGKPKFSAEGKMVKSDKTVFWASIRFVVIPGDIPNSRYVCATYRDISDLKEANAAAQQALRARNAALEEQKRINSELKTVRNRLYAALDAYPDPIVIYDSDLKLVSWNDSYAKTVTENEDDLFEGMHLEEVLRMAAQHGRYPVAVGREDEWLEGVIASTLEQPDHEDVEVAGDIHHRLIRSRSSAGDHVQIRVNITEFVRQKRVAEAAQARLIGALNAYPSPFAIYDADDRLVVWNHAYRHSMTDNPDGLYVGIHRLDAAREAIRSGRITHAVGREDEWLSSKTLDAEVDKPVQDLEIAGDIHHRLLRSRAENGDLVMLRIDTTELVRQRRALERAQDRLMYAINAYPDPFAIYDQDLNLAVWNPAFAESVTNDPAAIFQGIGLRDILRMAVQDGKIAPAVGREEEWIDEYCSRDLMQPGVEDIELQGNQHYRIVRSPTENGELVVLRLNISEVVDQRRAVEDYAKKLEVANQEITYKALHDDLTGLGNRRHLSQRFKEMVSCRDRDGGEIAALHIDLDRFKQINDTMGHLAGDKVLLDVSQRICASVEASDVVARIGGDEFVVLLHVTAESERPEQLAQSMLEQMSRPVLFDGKECRFGASIGLARTPLADVDDLLTNSDVALYKAKNAGRGQLGIFDKQDLEEVRHNKRLADDLLRAIEHEEFVPYYQPQVDAITGEVVGMEALARWKHPEKGILAPGYFLSVATDLNIAADIDRMIFERAIYECQDAFGNMAHPPSLSFNVSAKRVHGDQFHAIQQHIKAYSGQVCFELLETIFLEEEDQEFLFQLDRLRDVGIAIEVDDFGSGRASVVALQRIGPDRVKIDRRLVTHIAENESSLRMLRSIVEIGFALEMGITAEGVETKEQADILARLGCDRLQGYYIARPMGFENIVDFVNSDRNKRFRA